MEYSNLKNRIANISASLRILVDALDNLYEKTRQITPAYIRDLAQRNFAPEINTVRDATLSQELTSEQSTCVHTANRELKAALVRGKYLTGNG